MFSRTMFDLFALARKFSQKKVTTQVEQNYLWVFAVLGALFAVLMNSVPLDPSMYALGTLLENSLNSVVGVIGAILPLVLFLMGNAKGDGKNPVVRYTLLTFDAYLHYGLLALLLVMVFAVIMVLLPIPVLMTGNFGQMIFWLLFNLVLSWHMFVAGKIASGAKN
ncbi:hypothetical protein COW46_00310 [Candidatus Gracilibacteria bacterium CG17_big_fil_post_rev_8_21_14_2_50_48_13]|nr:MAG: hypothetical protein COW46_00310 [Candidatus Gracilibacteria bacterium CG17_big_fil_post_rev_8_21_14_2_50_48_13]